MTSRKKQRILNRIWECLQSSSIGQGLENGCRKELLGPHLKNLERSPTLISTIPIPAVKDGWFSIWQQGGGIIPIIWATDRGAKDELEELRQRLGGIVSLVQIRWTEPCEWLAQKGWPLRNGCTKSHGHHY